MIIHGIQAENLLKYRKLELNDLPAAGTIAISGQNESGKSSIGETICFALFGRSFAVSPNNVEKLIRWGEDRCTVSVDFSVGEGERYVVTRYMDRDGNHSARLNRAEDPDTPVARGVDAVADALYNVLGYEFDEFIESFYLAQREITTPHPHSYAVKIMAGIAPMEHCRHEFEEEVERDGAMADEADAKVAEVAGQLEALAFDEQVLEGLERERAKLGQLDARVGERRADLLDAAADYQEREPKMRAAEGSRSTASGFRFFWFLLAAVTLGVWGLLAYLPEQPAAQQLAGLIQQNVPAWQPQHLQWLLYAGIGCAVLFLLFWVRAATLSGRIRVLRDTGGRLRGEMDGIGVLEPEIDGILNGRAAADADGDATVIAQRADPDRRDALLDRVDSGDASADEVRAAVEREAAWLDRGTAAMQVRRAELDERIDAERARQDEHNKLSGMREAFEQQAEQYRHRVKVRELADELLLGTARHLSHRFNHNLRGMAGKTLPTFTEGRYEHLKIDEDLTVQVFSNEKRDFMDLEEISSGTQRQIMLALRLALSQELINRVVKERQFVFLDEPFAFFDETRTRSSLSVLPALSEDVKQIFIIGQQFPADMSFDATIRCARDSDTFSNAV